MIRCPGNLQLVANRWQDVMRQPYPSLSNNPLRLVCFALVLLLAGPVQAAEQVAWQELVLRRTDGQPVLVDATRINVVCFLGTECPLARLYGPRLQALADEFADQGVSLIGVDSNVQDSPREIDEYCRKHAIRFPIVKDTDQSVANALGATRTPEVFVIDAAGSVRYQGRIDDQYEPGVSRAKPTRSDLRDAIKALLRGDEIRAAKTQGVGCLITRIPKSTSQPTDGRAVTFNRDVAPILNAHCVECHRKGEIGPMELTDYDEVLGWGDMILEVIDQQRMPPWHADPDVGHFVGERRMPAQARQTIASWLEQGMTQGDPADLQPPPDWNGGWQFDSKPDQVFEMRGRPFVVPADGVVEYQYFVVDPQWTEDRWIKAAQVVPGDASVVHHAIVFVRPPDDGGFRGSGWMGAYVPGQRAVSLPPGHARFIPAGSKLVFQMHYTPNGQQTNDLTRVGIWQIDPEEVTHEVYTQVAIDHQFEIPPGAANAVVKMTVERFPPDSRMLGITPHMHLRGKSFELTANMGQGESSPLLRVPRYDFNWQHWYEFAEPVDLTRIKSLEMQVAFDNSTANPFNPAPDEYVSWGDQTWEEMAVAFFDVAIPRGGPRYKTVTPQPLSADQLALRESRIEKYVAEFLSQMDSNGDGVIEREEAPVTFRRFGFYSVDRNGDRRIERDEIRAVAAERL